MSRSKAIGHCVCDPRKACPCPSLTERNICTCAGETEALTGDGQDVRLTRLVRSAGCASKIGQKDLREILGALPTVEDPRILVGMGTADDAGVFRLDDGLALVQTVDVFTPTVDDPYLFGRIAACNSLSDVYAMGGRPLTALSIIGFPVHRLPRSAMGDMLRGGMDTLRDAETVLLGGHSVDDEEPKLGYAVTGLVDPARIVTNAGARPGEVLILTKPLGTGIVSFALQLGEADESDVRAAGASMATLNRVASEVMIRCGATAATDVTGFGLLGHLAALVAESRVTAELWPEALPLLPGVERYAGKGYYSGAIERNAEFAATRTELGPEIQGPERAVLLDPQTSGGLLFTVSEALAQETVDDLRRAGIAQAAVVGRIVEASEGRVVVRGGMERRTRRPPARPSEPTKPTAERGAQEADMAKDRETECCSEEHGGAGSAIEQFSGFLGAAMRPGALDVVTKELIAVALGLAVHCVPCAKSHLKKATTMGISRAELEEAAALAVAFSGCRALMLWKELEAELPRA